MVTLCMIYDDERILLGMKKRDFGQGKWNGFGGKVADGETIEDAARRETLEEAGIELVDLTKRGVITFYFEGKDYHMECHFFSSSEFKGEPVESDEMRPCWFTHDQIPFDDMWADDPHWMPLLLSGKNFEGEFTFGKDKEVVDYRIKEI